MNIRRDVLGVKISATNYNEVLSKVAFWIKTGQKQYICVAAVHLVMECQNNPELLSGINKAGFVTPDGMPLVWLSKLSVKKGVERVYGPTLMSSLCDLAQKNNWKIFLLGGAAGQGRDLVNKLKISFPGIKIAGFFETPGKNITPKNNQKIISQINKAGPQIVFVGTGCPYQELWMIENRSKISPNILIGVGAAFDFITGKEKQAPAWIQNAGLEWFYRLTQNPRRLWYRYTTLNVKFIYKLLRSCLSLLII